MILHLLTQEAEKYFFLEFAYLLAIAAPEANQESLPVQSYSENREKNEFSFEKFVPGFEMQVSELLMLRKFASEVLEEEWKPVSSYQSHEAKKRYGTLFEQKINDFKDSSPTLEPLLEVIVAQQDAGTALHGKLKKILLETAEEECTKGTLTVHDKEALTLFCDLMPLFKEVQEMENNARALEFFNILATQHRTALLRIILALLVEDAKAKQFPVEKRKAILLEATAMAYADGSMAEEEELILHYYCELCDLDRDLLEDFMEITSEFSLLYKKSMELVTE